MSTHANTDVSPSPAAVALEPEVGRCGACGEQEQIWMHCSRCGKALGAECVMESELASGKCSACAPAKLARRRRGGR